MVFSRKFLPMTMTPPLKVGKSRVQKRRYIHLLVEPTLIDPFVSNICLETTYRINVLKFLRIFGRYFVVKSLLYRVPLWEACANFWEICFADFFWYIPVHTGTYQSAS